MGEFALTCAISGLPIDGGDEVRYFLLNQNPYKSGRIFEIYGYWFPRTWPIKAKYNSYGSIEDWEDSPVQKLIMKGFQKDLVEIGVGDNDVHDVAARKDMPFEEFLNSLWEGRVYVSRGFSSYERSHKAYKAQNWVPTLKSVENLLKSIPGGRYSVDEKEGYVRVRLKDSNDEGILMQAKACLEEVFAVARTAGGGQYPDYSELRCFIAPGKTAEGYTRRDYFSIRENDKGNLAIREAMIREDVWQKLLTLKTHNEWDKKKTSIEEFKESARQVFKVYKENIGDLKEDIESSALLYGAFRFRDHPAGFLLSQEFIPFSNGLYSHWLTLYKDNHADESFMDLVAEFSFIWEILQSNRYVFRPSETVGSQYGDFKSQAEFHKAIASVASAEQKRKKSL